VKKPFKVLKLITINLLVLFLLLEIGSAGIYWLRTREFFYTRSNARLDATKIQFETGSAAADTSLLFQLHPYFGFVNKADSGLTRSNGSGFWSTYEYPFKRTKNQFVIGIFGGSVAANLYLYEQQGHALASALKQLPSLRDREIVVLCFALGAYKQPQQLLLLNYFLSVGQDLDLVLNIDGFNEAALSYLNNKAGLEPAMPTNSVISPLGDLANKDLSGPLLPTLELMLTRNQIRESLNRMAACRLATCYTFYWMRAKLQVNRYQQETQALANAKSGAKADGLLHLDKLEGPLSDSEWAKRMAEVWAHSSLMMNQLLAPRNIPYIQVIQPNQYYLTKRQFSKAEREIAIIEPSLLGDGIAKGYPEILSRLVQLRAAGVNIFDGTTALDQVEGMVYLDNCCHYNPRGNAAFESFIVNRILTVLKQKMPSSGTSKP
jgi:hypothetical protein